MSRLMYGWMFAMMWLVAAGCSNSDGENGDTNSDTGDPSDGGDDGGPGDSDPGDTEPEVALVVDDFEDGDGTPLVGVHWYTYSDVNPDPEASQTGASVVEGALSDSGELIADAEGYESEVAFAVTYELDKGTLEYSPYVGFGVTLADSEDAPFDASEYVGLTYMYKGAAHILSVSTFNRNDGLEAGEENYDTYNISVPAASDWTRALLDFKDFAQAGWGTAFSFDLDKVENIGWQIQGESGESGTFSIDDLGFLGEGGLEPPEEDLTIRESDPPDAVEIESIEIDNPLQTLAMEALNKGYNLTNWLEQEKFETYAYGEDTVNDLAAAGFKALRLPIDLDLYIVDRADYFAGDADFEVEDLLFEILDNFEQWTAAADMSLTIDYHQYDKSFDMTDALYVETVVKLWTAVAEHFADNPREDLFFELVNEAELAGGLTDRDIDPEEYGEFAMELIDGIRSADENRVVLFGDVKWNAIDSLTERTPLDDDRVIYLFHYYEPFLFTHQGASWTSIPTSRGIPYPYSEDRWSVYSADFGIDPDTTDSWLMSQLHSYYKIGHKSAMWNKIVEAKQWAVDNNVPVICNEFGVYERTSLKEDRVRYYTDLIDIYAELEIPWQIWFMVMDEDGAVDSDLAVALDLQ